jgi:hypothetical protein
MQQQTNVKDLSMSKWIQSIKSLAPASIAAALLFTTSQLFAQDQPGGPGGPGGRRGNFDPEQMRQRMMERYREALEIKSDDEWKVIQPRIQKVVDARTALGAGGARFFGRPRGGNDAQGGGAGRGGRGGFGEPSAEAESLQTALDAKASSEEIKTKLAKLRESNKQKEAALTQAQEDLRKVLSVRQEAEAVLLGLLK